MFQEKYADVLKGDARWQDVRVTEAETYDWPAGSSRDWATKGTALLGIRAVIAESFERIHRSNLVGMGVIPFEFSPGENRKTLGLKGDEVITIEGLSEELKPLSFLPCTIACSDGTVKRIQIKCRIDTAIELEYIKNGGVLHDVLRNLAKEKVKQWTNGQCCPPLEKPGGLTETLRHDRHSASGHLA